MKDFADDKINVSQKLNSRCFGKSRKYCGKRRKCWLPAFSLFPVMFSKYFFLRVVKSQDCVVKSKAVRKLCYLQLLLNPFPNKPCFLRVCRASCLKTLREKDKLLITSNLSFSHSVFYPFIKLFAILVKSEIVVCILFQFERV